MLNPYDQSVYDAGYKYIPQSQYLLNPFQIPQSGGGGGATPGPGLPSINIGGGGRDNNFNPYNVDMSQIRTDYQPDYDFRRYSEYGMNPSTMARKEMDMYPDYFYDRPSAMQQKIGGLMNFIPGVGTLKTAGRAIGGFLKGILPENQRYIMENEARGAGIFTDDIGRIVTDDYNTAGGIMAGYNLNALTKEGSTALTDRKNTVMNTLENKYGLNKSAVDALRKDPNYTGPAKTLIDRLDLFDEFEDEINTINTKKKLITKMRKDKKAADKKKEEDDAAAAAAAAAAAKAEKIKKKAFLDAKNAKDSDNDGVPDYVEKAGGTAPGGMYATDYQGDPSPSSTTTSSGGGGGYRGGGADMGRGGGASYSGSASTGAKDGFGYGLADGGRVYYMDGGLADLVDIYD